MQEAIGYARLSIEDQSRHSIPGQVADITEYCKNNNLNLRQVFVDNGQSAFNFQRKEWKEVERYLKENRSVKYLIIIAMDRFSRANLSEALQKMDEIQRRTGVKILTVSDPVTLDIDDMGTELRRVIELLFSNYELKKIRKRTSDGLYRAMASGMWVSRAPIGFINTRDSEGKPGISPDPARADLVRSLFRKYLSGQSLTELAKEARQVGLKLYGNSSMRRLLSNPLYAGMIQLPKRANQPARLIRGNHSPIISEFDFWTAQEKLKGKSRGTQRRDHVYLAGIVHCECGLPFTSDKSKGRGGKEYTYYVCKKHREAISTKKLHDLMAAVLHEMNLPETKLNAIREKLENRIAEKMNSKGGDMMRAKLELSKVQDKILSVEEKYLLQPDVSMASYKKVMQELKTDESRLEKEVAELGATTDRYHHFLNELLPRIANINDTFESWPLYKRQEFIKMCFDNSLRYVDGSYRTTFIHPLFAHCELALKEKGLLFVEQSSSNSGNTPGSSPIGSIIETSDPILKLFAA